MASAGDIGATKNKLTSTLIPRLHINPDFTVKFSKGVVVQRMFMSANLAVDLGINCGYCILRDQILTEFVFGGHDACQLRVVKKLMRLVDSRL